jgi:hypothetical protein
MKTYTCIILILKKQFIEIIIHVLELCLFAHEVEFPQIWSHFIMILLSFHR